MPEFVFYNRRIKNFIKLDQIDLNCFFNSIVLFHRVTDICAVYFVLLNRDVLCHNCEFNLMAPFFFFSNFIFQKSLGIQMK